MAVDKSSRLNIASNIAPGNYLPTLRQTFNNTQNWTVPVGVQGIVVVMSGGGGGGGSSGNSTNNGGAGGGGGGTGIEAVGVTPGDTVAITIGAGGNGGNGGASQSGNAGSATTVGIGNMLYTANGGSGGSPGNNTNGSGGGSTGNFNVGPKTAGTSGIQSPIPTNFVIEFSEFAQVFTTNTASWNTPARDSTTIGSTAGVMQTGSTISANIGNLVPYSGQNTNMVVTNNGNYLSYSGQGGQGGFFDSNLAGFQTSNYFISPRDGISGIVGGGGGGSALNGRPSGCGGGGAGGAGGDQNNTVQRGGGGGGGLSGAGATNTTAAGGAGGTGGGGGGAGVQAGAGAAGGAGAVLIYY
jgi:hypothetical protein